MNDWQAARLAEVLCGSPVIDARGALIGRVESVCADHLDTNSDCGVMIRSGGVEGRELFVTPAQIACVADDHVRLSVTTEAIAASRTGTGPG